jgi:hypothetical protein
VLAPVYFHHRYQLEAAIKVVGGLDYAYSVRGMGPPEARPVAAGWQRRALAASLAALAPETLDIPEQVVRRILPRPPGYPRNVELFSGGEAPAFDPLAAAAAAADMVAAGLLQRERAARLVDFHRRDPALPAFEEVMEALVDRAFGGPGSGSRGGPAAGAERHAELRRVVQWVVVRRLLDLAADPAASPGVKARVEGQLQELERALLRAAATHKGGRAVPATAGRQRAAGAGQPPAVTARTAEQAHRDHLAREIRRFLERHAVESGHPAEPPPPPPGQPIGAPGTAGATGVAVDSAAGPGAAARAAAAGWAAAYGAGAPPTLTGCSWDE